MTSLKVLRSLAFIITVAVIIVFLTLVNGPSNVWVTMQESDEEIYASHVDTVKWEIENTSQILKVQNLSVILGQDLKQDNDKQNSKSWQSEHQRTKDVESERNEDIEKPKESQINLIKTPSVREQNFDFSKKSQDDSKIHNTEYKENWNMSHKHSTPLKPISKIKRKNEFLQNINMNIDIDSLAEVLKKKLRDSQTKELELGPTCNSNKTIANSCEGNKKCMRMKLPKDIKRRVAQLVSPSSLQISRDIHAVLQKMGREVSGHYDVILLTAASSNHYFESQAMIKNVHEYVFPVLKNFKFLFYNLGLSATERQSLVKYCKCQVLDFPFDQFPGFMDDLHCFSWKPVLIKAHVQQANVLIWADASIRFHPNSSHLKMIIEQTRQRGIQIGGSYTGTAFRTFRSMYHYFGDEPCIYLNMGQAKATVGFYTPEPFVIRAILEPWVGCALHKECMCTTDKLDPSNKGCAASKKMVFYYRFKGGNITYGLCHRADQSAISLILHKLYQGYYRWVMVNVLQFLDIRRRHTEIYFPN